MEIKPKDLKSLFIYDPQLAIEYCQVVISTTANFERFLDFHNYHSKNSHISTCQNSWGDSTLSINCTDCGIDPNSCICLHCFLNGNHQGHNYFISKSSSGNCDCGDTFLWKRSGFCTKHHGVEHDTHPEDYLDEKLRTLLTDIIFKSSLGSITKIEPDDTNTLSIILQFLQSFLRYGDGFRRLLSISLTEKVNFEKFMNHIFDFSTDFNQRLKSFFGLLINDELFKNNFSRVCYKIIIDKIIPVHFTAIKTMDVNILKNIFPWTDFWYNCFGEQQIQNMVKIHNLNWIDFIIQILIFNKEIFDLKDSEIYTNTFLPRIFYNISDFAYFAQNQTEEKKQILFDKFITEVLTKGTTKGIEKNENDTIIATSFNQDLQKGYFDFSLTFIVTFYQIIRAFKKSKNLKLDELFKELNKSFDIGQIFLIGRNPIGNNNYNNENDKLVNIFVKSTNLNHLNINENDYKSFQNGASFYVSNPLLYTLAFILRNDESCRLKVAEFLSREEYQSVRIQIGIATLKSLLSMVCFSQSLVPKTNEGINSLYSNIVNNSENVNWGIPLLFPLLQLIIGIKCKENKNLSNFSFKEFFAFEMAREIGIFDDSKDDFNEGNKKQMIFSFLYLSLLFVIERKLFNFDGYDFCKEQLIFELKQGVSDLNELSNLFDYHVNEKMSSFLTMNKIIHEVATPRQNNKKLNNENNNQDVSFDLKEGVEVNFISAINSFNREKVLMNDEIKKHPNTLIKIQQFEPEETYFFKDSENIEVKLNEYLVTPTVLAIVYKTLRKSSESHTNELNDHLAMNILILISKFVQDSSYRSNDSIKPRTRPFRDIKYKSISIVDLINQLKKSVFNYEQIFSGNAFIRNTITKESFDLFLQMKICSQNESPKSIIDILLEKGELGKTVLNQIGIKIEGDKEDNGNDKSKQDVDQMKKNRAQKLKEDILSHYKSISSSFNLIDVDGGDDDDDDNDNESSAEKDVCSICSQEKKDEILSYPLYIYRTKFPFIFDKPPVVEMAKRNSMREADVFQDEDILETTRIKNDNDSDNEDEQVPDSDAMLADLISRVGSFDIVDGMDDTQAELNRNSLEIIHQAVLARHEELVQQAEQRKNQRKQARLSQFQQEKDEFLRKQKELVDPNSIVSKRCTAGNIFVIQFGICQHLVHPNCVQQDDFTCPIDRSFKNGFLPNIDDLTDDVIYADKSFTSFSEKLNESLAIFINKFSSFFKASEDKIIDVFVELVKSISGLIVTFEVRLRNLPDCLDSLKTKILARNLFLASWYAYRMKGKPVMKTGFTEDVSEKVDSKLTVFQRFIKKLIESDEIEKSVTSKNDSLMKLVSSFIESSFSCTNYREEKEMCLFLRRVCLADHFLLKKSNEVKSHEIIDWDEILSSENLSQKFNVSFKHLNDEKNEFEFKPFVFAKLPKEFLCFAKEPYNFPVELIGQFTIFNMLNYNEMIAKYDDLAENDDDENKVDYMNDLSVIDDENSNSSIRKMFSKKNYPSVYLLIGKNASKVCVVDGKRTVSMRPFYLDRYGCTDIGYSRSQPLFLNEERYERFMDQILSGEFANHLQPF